MKRIRFLLKILTVAALLCLSLAPAASAASPSYLLALRQGLQQGLESLDAQMAQASREVGGLGIRNPKVNDVMRLLLVGQSFTISCSIISAGGFMVAVEPAEFSRLEDYNLRVAKDRPHKQASTEPAMTRRFPTAEGGWAVALTQPIKDDQGKFLGWLSLLLDPDGMMQSILEHAPPAAGQEVWLVQGDGGLLYHPQTTEIGRNLLNDPAYLGQPGKAALGHRLQTDPDGEFKADMASGLMGTSAAQAHWVSLGLHGTDWRLVLLRPAD